MTSVTDKNYKISFIEYMNESSIRSILKKEFPDVRFNIDEKSDMLDLDIIVVQYKERNKGIGTKFMKRLVELAKKFNKRIYLTPDDSYAEPENMNKQSLEKWYKKFGFQKKEDSDTSSKNTMVFK